MKRLNSLLILLILVNSSFAQLNINYYLNVGRAQLYNEKFSEAIESFNTVIRVKPKLPEAYFLRGIAKYNLMDYLGAEQDYSKAIEFKPNYTYALKYRGHTRYNLKKYYLAINDFEQAISLDATDPDLYNVRGLCKINVNQYEQAIYDFNSSLDITKKNKRAYFYRGIARVMAEDTLSALSDYKKALKLDPNYYDVYMNIGILYSEQYKYDTAIINFTKVIELDPLNDGAYINRSIAYYNKKNLDAAIQNLDTAIQINPKNSLALFNRALIKNENGLKKEAITDFDKVIFLNPQNILTYFNRGLIKLEINDLQGAFIDFTQAIEIYPDFVKAYINRSIVRHKLNDAQGAFADREKANQIIASVQQRKDSHVSYADTTENLRSLITLKSSNRFYNNPKFSERIEPESNFTLVFGDKNSKYFDRLAVLYEYLNTFKIEFSYEGLVINKEIDKVFDSEFIKSEIDRLNNEYPKSKNKIHNLIQSSIYKSLIKNYNEALSDLDLAIKKEPDNFIIYFCRANIRSEMIDYIKQLEQENEIILVDPLNKNNISTLKKNENIIDYQYVIDDYLKTLELSPEFIFAAYNLANTYLSTRNYNEAIELYNQIIKSEPIFAEAFYNRGLTYIYLKQSENGCMDMSVSGELGLQSAYSVIARFCDN